MSERPKKPSESKEKPAVTAVVRARDMLCELSGQRGWNDTRESWLARGARRAGLTLRRARAIFYCEPIRLDADEYLAIEGAWKGAHEAVAQLTALASHADVRAGAANALGGQADHGKGGSAGRQERPAAHASFRSAR